MGTFDPCIGVLNLNLNWLAIASAFLKIVAGGLASEVKLVAFSVFGSSVAGLLCRVFILLLINNLLGLTPYVFTAPSHVSYTLPLAITLWISLIGVAAYKTFTHFLAHLVPSGTPLALVPFIVLIELISSIMRPFTLAIRLAANMVAGHLLLVLVSSPAPYLGWGLTAALRAGVLTLTLLEFGVAVIQSYVFIRLSSLYIREVNSAAML